MNNYDFYILGALAVSSAVTSVILVSMTQNSVQLGLKGRYALDMISLGDDPQKYRDTIQDAKIDGLAGLIMGGRRALFRAFHKRKEAID